VGACKGCMLTRIAVADVVGHGHAVSDVSQYMYDSLKVHICDPDSGIVLSELNQLAARQGLKAMTTAAVLAYSGVNREAYLSRAGHPPVLRKRANEESWSVVAPDNNGGRLPNTDLPLAVAPEAVYRQQVIPATSGDRLFIYTDGVTEAPSAAGELFGDRRLHDVLDANAGASVTELKSAVLQALHEHTGNGLTHDDVTLIAMEVR
ncbi:MAG TPA: PP2C family protein-serine/threonine phosphatase, partial [Phycisphaerae bacterium]|nr:PP2C family protein-serine/threonine phosphatase [Phycisphaerae bacterium]